MQLKEMRGASRDNGIAPCSERIEDESQAEKEAVRRAKQQMMKNIAKEQRQRVQQRKERMELRERQRQQEVLYAHQSAVTLQCAYRRHSACQQTEERREARRLAVGKRRHSAALSLQEGYRSLLCSRRIKE